MKFSVSGALSYDVRSASTFILNIHALKTRNQIVLQESFTTSPEFELEELRSIQNGNRYVRFEIAEPTYININYSAQVETSYKLIDCNQLVDVPVMQLDAEVIPYLFPSRYCQSDKLFRFAHNKFGKIENAFEKVLALTNWIHDNVEYLSGSTNSQTSAYDTVTEQAGVCRDFAHLGIALCRALDIPARYFTGYAYQLNPPDFHACFEAFLGHEWVFFDATKLVPLNGMVKIATGRDAADAAVGTMFGNVTGTYLSASCLLSDSEFTPYYYRGDKPQGLVYL